MHLGHRTPAASTPKEERKEASINFPRKNMSRTSGSAQKSCNALQHPALPDCLLQLLPSLPGISFSLHLAPAVSSRWLRNVDKEHVS